MPGIASSKPSFRVDTGPEPGTPPGPARPPVARIAAFALACCAAIAAPAPAQDLPERALVRIVPAEPDADFPAELDAQAQAWIGSRDFARIDALHARYLAQAERTASGEWKCALLADALAKALSEPEGDGLGPDWARVEAVTLGWARSHRDSALARTLHARAIRAHAERATAYDDRGFYRVRSQRQPERDALLRRAMDYLQREQRVASRDPEYAVLLMSTAADLGDYARAETVFEQAMSDQPDYFPIYSSMLGLLREKPETQAVERYARRVLSRHEATIGRELYARLYSDYAQDLAFGPDHLFAGTQAKWADMRAGFEDRIRRYPSQDNLQTYARFACIAGDPSALHELWPRLQAPLWRLWQTRQRFEACGQLAAELQRVTF